MGDPAECCLYRMWSRQGALLYVGISLCVGSRIGRHRETKGWWGQVARIEVEKFCTREAALAAERAAIRSERPAHNVQHNAACKSATRQALRRSSDPRHFRDCCDRCMDRGKYAPTVPFGRGDQGQAGMECWRYRCDACGYAWKCWWGTASERLADCPCAYCEEPT